MTSLTRNLLRFIEFLASVLLAPVLLGIAALALLLTDLAWIVVGRRNAVLQSVPRRRAVSIVIPNWNGRDLLEKYLPSVMEAAQSDERNEVVVVDNASTDGSAEFLAQRFPSVRVLKLIENRGFGGGSNAGFLAAKNDIVVLLNSDMRVDPNFLDPLIAGFTDESVFAVSCQIYFTDPSRRREETGLTEGRWEHGKLRVSHREDPAINELFPCFYAGGGSAAFHRPKFLELGGFDSLLAPFYLEDTDLSFMAWKRGWKVLFQPSSVVFHEHRGTIGRRFSDAYIQSVLKKNHLLFAWKNIHAVGPLLDNFAMAWGGAIASAATGSRPLRTSLMAIARAFVQLPQAAGCRWKARSLAHISDAEAFARSRASHFRDRFLEVSAPDDRLRVLFVSPYPILPPAHGGAVFMLQTLQQLSRRCEVHALVLLDEVSQASANSHLEKFCASVEMMVRPRNGKIGSIHPHAVEEFRSPDVRWFIDRMIYTHRIDIVQMEYTAMGQYVERYKRIVSALFEHDIFFQSIARTAATLESSAARLKAKVEYLRALHFELKLLPRCDQIQVCTAENRNYLLEFAPGLAAKVRAGLRAAVDTRSYRYPGGPREPYSLLFVGSSRHTPNRVGMEWFVREVFPLIARECPEARLYVAGFDPRTDAHMATSEKIKLLSYVENVKPLFERYEIFVCPILSGSGVRVKLLEAFAGGVPVVSTAVGAEGLAQMGSGICALGDTPEAFAQQTLALLNDPARAAQLAARARAEVEKNWDSAVVAERLIESYRELLSQKLGMVRIQQPLVLQAADPS